MNNNPRARTILSICILLVLLAPGFALARRQQAGPSPAELTPDEYMPLILKGHEPTESIPATATGTATATATATPTGTRTATATSTATNTPTNTATATVALNTPTATTQPTVDAQANTYLQITNATGFVLTYSLIGPTYGDGVLRETQSIVMPIQTGQYTVTSSTRCQTVPVGYKFDQPNVTYEISVHC